MTRTFTRKQQGATLVELLVIMGVIGILARLVTLDLFRGQQRASLVVTKDTMISDIRKQQHRAMEGMTSSPGMYLDYSIRIENQRYILFPGTVFDENNPANDVVALDAILNIDPIQVPGNIITFSRISGEIRGYDEANHSVTLRNNQTGNQYTVQFNSLGVPFIE